MAQPPPPPQPQAAGGEEERLGVPAAAIGAPIDPSGEASTPLPAGTAESSPLAEDGDVKQAISASADPASASVAIPVDSNAEDRQTSLLGAEVFDLHDESPMRGNSMEDIGRVENDSETLDRGRATSEDWYALDDTEANKNLESQHDQAGPESSSSSSKPQVAGWASKLGMGQLGKKAGALGSKAKTALLSEAKMVAADAKDLALGVREGAQITIQDTKSLSKQLQRDAKALSRDVKSMAPASGWSGKSLAPASGWRGLWRSNSKSMDEAQLDDAEAESARRAEELERGRAQEVPASSSEALAGVEPDVDFEPDIRQATECGGADASAVESQSGGVDKSSRGGLAGSAAAAMRGWQASTAEVSSQMWRDLKDAKDEAVADFRAMGQEARHLSAKGVQKLRPVVGPSDGLAQEASTEASETSAQGSEGEADGAAAGQTAAVNPSPTEALDTLLGATCDDDQSPAMSSDARTLAERRYDEQTVRVAQKMKESASATAAVAANVWRKTEQSIKKGFGAMPVSERATSSGFSFEPEPRGEEERPGERPGQISRLFELPSTRANYVELSNYYEPVGATESAAASSKAPKHAASGVARSARSLGGKMAKRSREVTGNLLKQASNLSNQAGAVAARQTGRNVGSTGNADGGKGDDAEQIFEIGSDDEEELFAGDGNSGSDMVSGDAEAEETSSLPSSTPDMDRSTWVDAPAATAAVTESVPAAPVVEVAEARPPSDEVQNEKLRLKMMERRALTEAVEVPPSPPAQSAKMDVSPDAVDTEPPPDDDDDGWLLEAAVVASPLPPVVVAPTAPPAAAAEPPASLSQDTLTNAPPEQSSTRDPQDDDDWFNDMVGDDASTGPSGVDSLLDDAKAPAPAVPVNLAASAAESDSNLEVAGAATAAELAAAAAKEMEDLFGDSD